VMRYCLALALSLLFFMVGYALGATPATEMKKYKAVHPNCEACGRAPAFMKAIEVHHIKPQHAFPELANDPSNFAALCRPCHLAYGHAGDGACRRYVENLREVLALRVIKENK